MEWRRIVRFGWIAPMVMVGSLVGLGCGSGNGSGSTDGGYDQDGKNNGADDTESCRTELNLYQINEDGSNGPLAFTETTDACRSFAMLSDDKNNLHLFLGASEESDVGEQTVLVFTATFEILESLPLNQEFNLSGSVGAGVILELIPPDGSGDFLTSYGRPYKLVLYMTEVGTGSRERIVGEFREITVENSFRDLSLVRMDFKGRLGFSIQLPDLPSSGCERWSQWNCEGKDIGGCDASCADALGSWSISCPAVGKCTCRKPGQNDVEISAMGGDCERCEAVLTQCAP